MEKEKANEISNALSGISYSDWKVVQSVVENRFHQIKKELTYEEINSRISDLTAEKMENPY
ncbi:hypothetical protein [Fructobacillus evanidus]|uniref:Uncharacterized protein n=1 Tax=Fructobacillus evanidus TaxID=3064281 RepID=A0ABM9MMU4_9LACO|nr:unnamed protein product [Fructobacillus sp. LMG 32999]CAK1222122.1 unnamed protein product [Fructobacillus sp. LMG 32999]CAK1226294.1 unnamed protein product [Fructobacillus sp. LMG 32999]CAK1226503.1 unnamed protein product [Fructobacillus sp. LMG 32999]CAK1226646.1 unnamed protein product [Fructobacillus sp. LMG 32999]